MPTGSLTKMEKPMADRGPLALPPPCCKPVNAADENATPCVKYDDDIAMDDCGRNEDEGGHGGGTQSAVSADPPGKDRVVSHPTSI